MQARVPITKDKNQNVTFSNIKTNNIWNVDFVVRTQTHTHAHTQFETKKEDYWIYLFVSSKKMQH